MTCSKLPARLWLVALAGMVSLAIAPRASAQWADQRYQNRVPLTVTNYTSHAFASGELVTATLPASVISNVRPDGADVAIYQGSTPVSMKLLPMGGSLKAIMALPTALPPPGAYTLTENLSAGKTDYATLPAGTRISFPDNSDDDARTVTLPFVFPFKSGPSNQISVNTDGMVTPGPVDKGRSDTLAQAVGKTTIMPYGSDFQITTAPSTGIYADLTNPAQATIRWEVYPSGGSSVVAKFALILKPNGDIRFVYGSPCLQDTTVVTWSTPKYGVGVGDPAISLVTEVPDIDFANHADITYTQGIPTYPSQTFALYYNGPSVTTGPTAPATLQSWDFSDGQKHGWRSHQDLVNNADMKIVVDSDGVSSLYMDSSDPNDEDPTNGNHVWFSPNNMTPLGDQTVYWKARRPDWDNQCFPAMRVTPVTLADSASLNYITLASPAIGFQFGENPGAGGFLVANYFLPADPPYSNGRTPGLPYYFSNHTWTSNPVDPAKNQYFVTASWDTDGKTMLGGKGWQVSPAAPTAASDPAVGDYTMTWDTSSDASVVTQPVPPGIIAWMHHSNSALLKWVYAVPGGYAERITTGLAAAETAPAPGPGKAVIQGVAYDASIGVTVPMAGITLTVKDAANNVLATSVTDSTGRYRYVVNAGPAAANLTITGTKPGSRGTATQAVVENNTYTVNVPIAFGARAKGIVYDTQTNGGIVGATINLLSPGTSTVMFTTTTDATGQYVLDMDTAGSYDVAVTAGSYTPQTVTGVAYASQSNVTTDFGLIAPEMLPNGGFETEAPVTDPAGLPGAVRPAGWTTWNQTTPAETTAISNDVAQLDDVALDSTLTFYLNNASRARTGTHCVAIKRVEGIGSTSVQWMSDTGSLIPVSPNQRYRVSIWAKGTAGMQIRARVRFSTTNFAASSPSSVLTGSDTTFYADRVGGRWTQFSAFITAPSTPAFMMVRIYGSYAGTMHPSEVVYFDDASVKPISPRIISGHVVDGAAAVVAGVAVGANLGRPGMTDPDVSATSSTVGEYTLTLWDKGVYSIQTYKPGFMAGPQTMLDTAASYAAPTPITLLAPATPAVDIAVAAKVSSTDAAAETPDTFLSVPDILGFDGSNVNRGGGQWSQWRSKLTDPVAQLPITITADLGKAFTFSQMTWAWAWAGGGSRSYDIQTSPDGTAYTNAYQALSTGGNVWPDTNGNTHSCVQLAAPVNARYVRLILRSLDRVEDANIGFSEFRVDLPAANVTGQVTKLDGTPITGAFVGTRGGSGSMVSYGTTDATGTYTIALPTNNTVGLVAHYLPDGDHVVAISDPLDASASASSTVTIPTIKVGNPVLNLMPVSALAYSEPSIDEGGNPATNGVDHNFTTRWGTDLGTAVRPDSPVGFVFALGGAQTFNQANIMWESGFAGWYTIDVSDDATTWRNVLTNHSNYSGYTYAGGKFVDVQSLPTTTASYVRVLAQWNETQWTSIWELQLANVAANPPAPFTLTKQALKIAAGLLKAAGADMTPLNVVTTGTSAAVIDMADVVALAKLAR